MEWFPKLIIGLIAAVVAINILPMLLEPFGAAIILALIIIPVLWIVARVTKDRSKK